MQTHGRARWPCGVPRAGSRAILCVGERNCRMALKEREELSTQAKDQVVAAADGLSTLVQHFDVLLFSCESGLGVLVLYGGISRNRQSAEESRSQQPLYAEPTMSNPGLSSFFASLYALFSSFHNSYGHPSRALGLLLTRFFISASSTKSFDIPLFRMELFGFGNI